MTLTHGSTYWLTVDGYRVKDLSFLKHTLSDAEKRQIIMGHCKRLGVSPKGGKVQLLKTINSKSYAINGGKDY